MGDILVTVIDVESTGLDYENDLVTEVGMCLWNATENKILRVYGAIVYLPEVVLSDEITELTGITNEDIHSEYASPAKTVQSVIKNFGKLSNFFMAHRAEFDFNMLKGFAIGDEELLNTIHKPWIDTLQDVPFKVNGKQSASLPYLCADHGFLNYFPHRATFDACCTAKIAGMYKFEDIIERANSSLIKVIAQVSYDDRNKTKDQKFRWEPDTKQWYKEMCKCDYVEGMYDFNVILKNMTADYPRPSL